MSAELQILLWGIATVSPLFLNLATKREADAIGLSAMLLAGWCFGRLLGVMFTPPESMTLYPVMDFAFGVVTLAAWRSQRAWWKLGIVGLLLAQCAGHLAFWIAWPADGSLYRYVLANNVLFALELLSVSVPGGLHVADHLVGSLSSRFGNLRHARAK